MERWKSNEYNGEQPKVHSILYAGTVNHRKGYADIVKAFAKIAHSHKDWQIVFAGNGEIEQGKALAESLGISGQTKWLGWGTASLEFARVWFNIETINSEVEKHYEEVLK